MLTPVNNNPYNPNFCAYKSVFSRNMENLLKQKCEINPKQKTSLIEMFRKVLASRQNQDKLIGTGCFSKCYKIDDYYVMRVPRHNVSTNDFAVVKQDKRFAKLKTYLGTVIAKVGNIEILENAGLKNGGKITNCGIPVDFVKDAKKLRYYTKTYLPEFSNIPQRGYDIIAEDFKILNSIKENGRSYTFDTFNANNFLKAGTKIKTVDKLELQDNKQIRNNLITLLDVFLKPYGVVYRYRDEITWEAIKMQREIFEKCLRASVRAELPIKPVSYYDECVFYAVLKNLGIKADSHKVLKRISAIHNTKCSVKEKDAMMQAYIQKLYQNY